MDRKIGAAALLLAAALAVILAAGVRCADEKDAEPMECVLIREEPEKPEKPAVQMITMVCELTAYCPCEKCCGQWAGGYTATGTVPTARRTVGVDPEVIPLGATVYIDGQAYRAEDTGAFAGNIIDIYMESHEEALRFGRKEATVTWAE